MKKTLQKLAFSALAIGSMALLSTSALAQGGSTPTYRHVPFSDTRPYFIKGAHSSLSQGVVTDRAGRVWTISYNLGFYVVNPDGTEYRLTSGDLDYETPASNSGITQDYVSAIYTDAAGVPESLSANGRGIALAHDGNILVTAGLTLWKLNSVTGQPMARWRAPSAAAHLGSPSSDAQGNIFLPSLTTNRHYIVKQSATAPATFDVVMAETAFEPRNRVTGSVVRNAAISRDGRTLYIPYGNASYIEKYTSTDMVNWTHAGDIENGAPSNAIWAGPNNMLYYVTFGTTDGERPALHFRDENNLSHNWRQVLTEVLANDIRGLALSAGHDTIYVANGDTNGNIHRFVTTDPIVLGVRKDALAKLVNAFPVPSTGQVTIEMPASLQRSAKVQVTDLSGKNVSVRQSVISNGCSLDLTGLASGTYLVVVNTNDGKIVRRIIKQ